MCGIAGFYAKSSSVDFSESLKKMAQALAHRGPDGEAIEIHDQVGLVHRRLSIIDLKSGDQPLRDLQGRCLIVNGEIYNYRELKHQFSNYPFQTQSDCEVILPLYERWGQTFTEHLRGMYSLALYDPEDKNLVLACDLFGMKQLYYAELSQGLIFASEPQALIETGLIRPEVNPFVRSEVLQLRHTASSATLFTSIQRLLPGEMLVVRRGEIISRSRDYKKIQSSSVASLEEALELFQLTFEDSVRLHLRSDVPYGLFLSGGLDSASLLKQMSLETSAPIKTYTIGFETGHQKDERPQAARLSTHYTTDHTEVLFTEKDFWKLLPATVAAQDDLVFDQAMVPTFKLASVASKDVKVVLCGEGGDETLAGYRRYQKAFWPTWLGGRLIRHKGIFDVTPFKSLLSPWRTNLEKISYATGKLPLTHLQQAQWNDFESWLPYNLMLKLDRCLMAHGLEGRTPYIDRHMFQQLFFLKDTLKIHKGQGKWVLRQWLKHHLPQSEPLAKKHGFTVPVTSWMQSKAARLAVLVAQQPGIEEFLPAAQVQDIFLKEKKGYPYAAWMLLVYALWHQRHILGLQIGEDTMASLMMR